MSAAIKKQVEFYFSDSNFRKDTFLRAAAETNADGFVPISVLLTFNKLKSITSDVNAVAEALKDSKSVVVSDDKLSLRRAHPMPETDCSKECTLYVKGFPTDDNDVTIDKITELFSQFGKVNMVRLRRELASKEFKGSCFIEYASPDEVTAAVKLTHDEDGKVTLDYKGQPYQCVMSLTDWLAKKEDKKTASKEKRKQGNSNTLEVKKQENEYAKGLIVRLENVGQDTNPMALKEFLSSKGEVKFVEVVDTVAYVRVGDSATATNIVEACKVGLSMDGEEGNKMVGHLLEGEEEENYWAKVFAAGANKRKSDHGGRGRGGGRGGRGGGRGGRKRQRN